MNVKSACISSQTDIKALEEDAVEILEQYQTSQVTNLLFHAGGFFFILSIAFL